MPKRRLPPEHEIAKSVRQIAHGKPRQPRRESAADRWFKDMKADHKANGTKHLESAKQKMAAPPPSIQPKAGLTAKSADPLVQAMKGKRVAGSDIPTPADGAPKVKTYQVRKATPQPTDVEGAERAAHTSKVAGGHGQTLGAISKAYAELGEHHAFQTKTELDPGLRASATTLAQRYRHEGALAGSNAAQAGRALTEGSEEHHGDKAEFHRHSAKRSIGKVRDAHDKLAKLHDEAHANHVAAKHGVSVDDARAAVAEKGASFGRGGAKNKQEAKSYQQGKLGGSFYISSKGTKVYAGKGHSH